MKLPVFSKPALGTLLHQKGRSSVAALVKRMIVDVAIVGFPKCGNTWYSALIRHLLIAHYGLDPEKTRKLFVSDIGGDAFSIFRIPVGKRLYHSHCLPYPREIGLRGMRESVSLFANKPMVVLIRDAKDALASNYFHQAFRTRIGRFTGSADVFVRSSVYGIEKFVAYYNLLAEIRLASRARTLITRYEELWHKPDVTLRRNLDFMDFRDIPQEMLTHAIAACSIDNMRRMERTASQETALVPGLFMSHSEQPEAWKVRKGGIGNWRECISEQVAREIDQYLVKNLNPYFLQSIDTFG